ncbi:acyl-CoA-like ligand-binding transcription factor [Prescottella equi]|uniref:acyl-CoA-like ligand-binding transcription factor n=1 Tax=Rhodococcus hoagii TaxID=43767 RepID=UPI001EEBA180|nr:hypothetical protein [Prescottella equi]
MARATRCSVGAGGPPAATRNTHDGGDAGAVQMIIAARTPSRESGKLTTMNVESGALGAIGGPITESRQSIRRRRSGRSRFRDGLASRPTDEPPLVSLRIAFEALLSRPRNAGEEERSKRTMRVLTSTASLRARNLEKHLGWAKMLVPVVEARLNGDYAELRAQTLVQSALACFDIALSTWAESEGVDAVDLLRRSFATLAAEDVA